jgi:hypothetical protein
MSSTDRASSAAPIEVIFRTPLGRRLFAVSAAVALGCVSAFMTAVAVLLLVRRQWALGAALVAPVACFVAGLTGYVMRDLRGKWGLSVGLRDRSLVLELPANRSLIHRPPARHVEIPCAEIEAIESRLEVYGSLGLEMMQRAYVLRRRNGELIFLFEERALATPYASAQFAPVAAAIAARADVPLRDLGMVEGRGGLLAVWGAHAADWATPPLTLAQQLRIWHAVAITGALPIPVIVFALLLRELLGG